MPRKLSIDVWSDIVCPWCAIGKHRLEQALAEFPHAGDVDVHWHAFELDPRAPAVQAEQDGDNAARLARKYGRSRDQALAMMRHVEETAARDGLELHLVEARSGNTFDAHRLVRFAAGRGLQNALVARFFKGYMAEGRAIGDREVLVRLASESGLDEDEARAVLEGDLFAAEVREDERLARELGIEGVPFFVFGGKYAVSGAQPAHLIRSALDQAWASSPSDDANGIGEGASAPDRMS